MMMGKQPNRRPLPRSRVLFTLQSSRNELVCSLELASEPIESLDQQIQHQANGLALASESVLSGQTILVHGDDIGNRVGQAAFCDADVDQAS